MGRLLAKIATPTRRGLGLTAGAKAPYNNNPGESETTVIFLRRRGRREA